MRNRNIALVLSILFVFTFMFSPVLVLAEDTAWFALYPDTAGIRPGDQFTITLKGQDTSDISTYEVVLVYDHDKLELTGAKSEMNGVWYPVGPKDKNGKTYFGYIKTSSRAGENSENKISSLTFKAKSAGNTTIKLESITLLDSNSVEHSYTPNKTVSVNISSEDANKTPETDTNPTPTPTPAPENGKIQVKPEMEQGVAVGKVEKEELDKAVESTKPDKEGIKEVTIEMSNISGVKRYVQQLPSEVVTSKTLDKKIRIETPIGAITIPGNMLKENDIKGEDKVQISIGIADKAGIKDSIAEAIGERPLIELGVKAGDNTIEWKNKKAPVTITLDYKPTAEELKDPEHIVVWYIDSEGKVVSVPSGKYDHMTQKVSFTTTHFSKYAVAFIKKSFDDLADYPWAKKEIEVMASKGIINGTSEKAYTPEEKITRADFMLLLVNALDLKAEADTNFSDVKLSDYYYEALGIAKKLGIANGQGDNKFNPEEYITRQDMMVLADRALRLVNKMTVNGSTSDLQQFADASTIADYAVNGIAAMIKEELVKGDGQNVNPLQNTTRAEAAVIIYRIYNK